MNSREVVAEKLLIMATGAAVKRAPAGSDRVTVALDAADILAFMVADMIGAGGKEQESLAFRAALSVGSAK